MIEPEMHTALFYALSASAQVLGALVALLGVFTIYRVQQLSNQLFNQAEAILIDIREDNDLKSKFAGKEPQKLLAKLAKNIVKRSEREVIEQISEICKIVGTESYNEWGVERISKLRDESRDLVRGTKWAIGAALALIAVFVAWIAFVPRMNNVGSCISLVVLVVLFGTDLCYIGCVLIRSLQTDTFEPGKKPDSANTHPCTSLPK